MSYILFSRLRRASAMEAAQEGEKEEMGIEKVDQGKEEEEQKDKEEEEALGRSREWATSCDKSVICDRGPGLVRLGSSLKVVERREEEEGRLEMERRRRRKMGENEKTREGHRLSVVLPRQRARSPVTVQVSHLTI